MSIPASLRLHIQRKVKDALASKPVYFQLSQSELPIIADKLVCALENSYPAGNNKLFSETGLKLAKAISVLSFDPKLLSNVDENLVKSVLSQYDEYLQTNQSIFENITNHHTNIMSEDWKEVTKDNKSLNVYSQAANSMGGKKWVVECNQWMETFALDYFRSGLARKHHIRKERLKYGTKERFKAEVDAENNEFSKLESDLLRTDDAGGFSRVRLLDVGSCYNPIAKSTEADKFDVTALDLYPADPTVYRCDFLNLRVGAEGSAPVAVAVADEASTASPTTSEADTTATKRRKVEEHVIAHTDEVKICESSQRLQQLPAGAYDAVTMSLVLNYLPTSEQRLEMVRRARALLVSPPNRSEPSDQVVQPHRNGLLLIAEKQSIFKSPASGNNMKPSKLPTPAVATALEHEITTEAVTVQETMPEVDLYGNWVRAINSCGFELVKYHYLPTSDGRKSHLFAFATVNLDPCSADASLKLSIKQDFEKQA